MEAIVEILADIGEVKVGWQSSGKLTLMKGLEVSLEYPWKNSSTFLNSCETI